MGCSLMFGYFFFVGGNVANGVSGQTMRGKNVCNFRFIAGATHKNGRFSAKEISFFKYFHVIAHLTAFACF